MTDILVIDDEPFIRAEIAAALKRRGYAVHEAEDGERATELLATVAPALVVTDILMPRMDGLELVKSLARLETRPPVIAISSGGADGYMEYLKYAKTFGADVVLEKPVDLVRLMAEVERLLAPPPTPD